MNVIVCPHCKKRRMVLSKVPRDAVAVMPCPSCHELAVLFRDKVIPLSREIIENGSFEDRKNHLAEVIAEFLDAGIFSSLDTEDLLQRTNGEPESVEELPNDITESITDQDVERFVTIDLKCIDDPSYFKKHLG